MNTQKDYRVTVKVRNNNLLKLIEHNGFGVIETAELIGITYQSLNSYINMTISPLLGKTENLKISAEKICEYFCTMPYEIWSENQLIALETNKKDIEVSYQNLICLEKSINPLKMIQNNEFIKDFDDSLETTLNSREQKVINLRYGIDGECKTLEEIAKVFNITRSRVRQIEDRALRKLRTPESNMKNVYETYLESR